MKYVLPFILILAILLGLYIQFNQSTEELPQSKSSILQLEAKDFRNTSLDSLSESSKIAIPGGEEWLEYDVNIPVAGHYQVVVLAKATNDTSYLWIEDYILGEEEQTHNITGNIPLKNMDRILEFSKFGSPLDSGVHKIKLYAHGAMEIEKIVFSLIREKKKTPLHLVQSMEGEKWEIVWSDEFNQTDIIDTTKWSFDTGNWGWGSNELQSYTAFDTNTARIEDGHLIIEAHKKNTEKWTSARLTTNGKVAFTYGKVEIKAKLPNKRGAWARAWMLEDDYLNENCGQINIMDILSSRMNQPIGTEEHYFPTRIDTEHLKNDFHIYAIEWSQDSIAGFVDGIHYFTYPNQAPKHPWHLDEPQNIILNLAIGGDRDSMETMDETFEQEQMIVDYIRVYRKI